MKFDRDKFFAEFRDSFGALTQGQVNGLHQLLACLETDPHITDIRWAAYMLATTKHETAHTFQPIQEYGGAGYFESRYGWRTRKGRELGNDAPGEGAAYSGKGYVQLTGEDNYEKAEEDLRREYPDVVAAFEQRKGRIFDLTLGDQPGDQSDPENAKDPVIAYCIMSYGMRHGRFTGKKLNDYINESTCDYRNARRIINGTDKADLIAGYAVKFERILRASLIE